MSIYDAVKQEMGDGPAWPSRPAFTTYYGYSQGEPLGAFSTERKAQLAGATVTEMAFDEEGYKEARRAARAHEQLIDDEWRRRVRAEYPSLNDGVFDIVLERAWDEGHASGYGEVETRLADVVDFAEQVIRATVSVTP